MTVATTSRVGPGARPAGLARLQRPSFTEVALVGLGVASTMKYDVGGLRVSYAMAGLLVVCLLVRYCLSDDDVALHSGGLVSGSMLIFCGGVLATALADAAAIVYLDGVRAVFGGMVLSILIVWIAWRLGSDVRYLLLGIVIGAIANLVKMVVNPDPLVSGRIEGMNHPNQTGTVLVLGIVFAWALRRDLPWRWTRSTFTVLAISVGLMYAISLTGSRSAAIAGTAALLWFLMVVRRSAGHRLLWIVLSGVVVVAIAAALAASPLGERLQSGDRTTESSDTERVHALEDQLELARESPLAGSGFEYRTYAHNVPLQVLNTGGFLAIAGFIVVLVPVVKALAMSRRSEDPGTAILGCAVIAIMVTWLLQNTAFDQIMWLTLTAVVVRARVTAPAEVSS